MWKEPTLVHLVTIFTYNLINFKLTKKKHVYNNMFIWFTNSIYNKYDLHLLIVKLGGYAIDKIIRLR